MEPGEGAGQGAGAAVAELPEAQPQGASGSGQQPDDFDGFSEEQRQRISQIVSRRVNEINAKWKPYEEFGKPDDLKARLARAQELEQFHQDLGQRFQKPGQLPGQGAAPPETDEDKKVRAYMERLYPWLPKLNEQLASMQQAVVSQEQYRWYQISESNNAKVAGWAKEAGYRDDEVVQLTQFVANSILANREDLAAYLKGNGDEKVMRRHFDLIDKWAKARSPIPPAAAQYAQTKAKTAALPPRLPAAGVPAPTSQAKKLSDKERVDAAYEAYRKT